jgi:hypothetical protein
MKMQCHLRKFSQQKLFYNEYDFSNTKEKTEMITVFTVSRFFLNARFTLSEPPSIGSFFYYVSMCSSIKSIS